MFAPQQPTAPLPCSAQAWSHPTDSPNTLPLRPRIPYCTGLFSCPVSSAPQQPTLPSSCTAQVCRPPAPTSTLPSAYSTGTSHCPCVFAPQQTVSPMPSIAQVCDPPADISTVSFMAEAGGWTAPSDRGWYPQQISEDIGITSKDEFEFVDGSCNECVLGLLFVFVFITPRWSYPSWMVAHACLSPIVSVRTPFSVSSGVSSSPAKLLPQQTRLFKGGLMKQLVSPPVCRYDGLID